MGSNVHSRPLGGAGMLHRLAPLTALVALLLAGACAPAPSAAPAPSKPAAAASGSASTVVPASAPASSAPAALEPLTYGYTALGANQWALYAAQARGYLAEQGIALDENNM